MNLIKRSRGFTPHLKNEISKAEGSRSLSAGFTHTPIRLLRQSRTRLIQPDMVSGFTIVELLVIVGVMGLGFFSFVRLKNMIFLDQTVRIVVADIRNAEFNAISSTKYNNLIRCGYGIVRGLNATEEYYTYTGPDASATNCTTQNRRYCAGNDVIIGPAKTLYNSDYEIKTGFFSIFFESPDPKIYLCPTGGTISSCPGGAQICDSTDDDLTLPAQTITIGRVGLTCNESPCKSICVYTAGRISVVDGSVCP